MIFLLLALGLGLGEANAASPPFPLLRDFADILYARRLPPLKELEDPALTPASREFGPSVISLAGLPRDSELATSSWIPWSSPWFPRAERDLFEDGAGTAPLEKYDLVRATLLSRESRAASWERERHRPDFAKWEGLCYAWALASLLFPEPSRSRTLRLDGGLHGFQGKRVVFSVSDQKALLLKTMEAVPSEALKLYGQRFRGDADGWIHPDLFPQELHRFVEVQLFERRQPFVMDHDPGVEVWNEPVYQANYRLEAVPGRNDAVFVRLWLYSAAPLRREEKDQVGTKELTREYNYFLYGKPDGKGNLVIESGVWHKGELVDSRRDHPDYVLTIPNPAAVRRESHNPEVEASVVDQILGR